MTDPELDPPAGPPAEPPRASLFDPAPVLPPPLVKAADPVVVRRRGGTPLLLTLLLFAALGGGLYWVWTNPQPVAQTATTQTTQPAADPQPAINAAKAEMLAKLQALSDRVDRLEKQPTAVPPAEPQAATAPSAPAPDTSTPDTSLAANADLAKRLDDISGHVAALATRQDQQQAALQKAMEIAAQKPADIQTPAPPPGPDPAIAQAQQQLVDFSGKLDQSLAQQRTALDALDQRLGKLEQAPSPAPEPAAKPDTGALDALDARVGKLEQGQGQIAGARQDAALAVKLESAQAALQAGQPLGVLPGAPPALARFATTPPPTEASLRAAFPKVAQAALAASRPDRQNDQSFLARALARAQQSITVRQGDHVIVGDPAAGVIARAQDDLNNGDLQGAVASLSALHGAAAEAVQGWTAQVHALLDARAALAGLAAHG